MKIYLNCDDNEITWNKKNYLLEADKRLGLGIFEQWTGGDKECILNIQPCDSNGFKHGTKWTGFWHIDVSLIHGFEGVYPSFDTVFLASSQGWSKFEGLVLFQALDPVLHRRYPEIEQKYDFVICGSVSNDDVYRARYDTYEVLKTKYKYVDFGKGHKPEQYVKNINQAKVQIVQSGISSEGKGMLAQRFFECLGIGPVLVGYTDDLKLTGLVDGVDYLSFKNNKELIRKMNKLLRDDKYRESIFNHGRQKALMYHSYEQRLMAIINTVNEYIPNSTT